jgi:hypothetical protein
MLQAFNLLRHFRIMFRIFGFNRQVPTKFRKFRPRTLVSPWFRPGFARSPKNPTKFVLLLTESSRIQQNDVVSGFRLATLLSIPLEGK